MDIDLAISKINPTAYYRHEWDYDSLVMLDGNPKPGQAEMQAAWMAWLNSEGKSQQLEKLEQLAERERLKYITAGDGKAMAYQQQLREVQRWEDGEQDAAKFPVANQMAVKLDMPVASILSMWQQNINAWLVIGGKIEANLAKAKLDLVALQVANLDDLAAFVANVDFGA
jgi:hypothetical protein